MVFRAPRAVPESRIPSDRRGRVVGRFCRGCSQVYPLQRRLHSGDPIYGRDHVASPCPYEGWELEPGAPWWEPAVEMLPPPPATTEAGATAGVSLPASVAPPPTTAAAPQQIPAAPAPKG